jgi:hypothetical protein
MDEALLKTLGSPAVMRLSPSLVHVILPENAARIAATLARKPS